MPWYHHFLTSRICWVEGAEVSLALGGIVTASHSRDVVTCKVIIITVIIIIIITVISPSSSGIFHMPPDQMDQPGAAGSERLREIRVRRRVWSGMENSNHNYFWTQMQDLPIERPSLSMCGILDTEMKSDKDGYLYYLGLARWLHKAPCSLIWVDIVFLMIRRRRHKFRYGGVVLYPKGQ